MEIMEDLVAERGEEEKLWGSMIKLTVKRRQPGFSESYHGFSNFSELLEEAQNQKLLESSTTRNQAATSSKRK